MSTSDGKLTHVDAEGRPRMVDVSGKAPTNRRAVATGRILMSPEALRRIVDGETPKGNVLQVAELAGIMAGKKTADLIPLCHPLPGCSVSVRVEADASGTAIVATAEATIAGPTGVEMEALTAVGVALLTVYDMAKAIDRGMRIDGIHLLSKEGGRSGPWKADP